MHTVTGSVEAGAIIRAIMMGSLDDGERAGNYFKLHFKFCCLYCHN